MDALAVVTSYEVSQFGIETVIVMPGAFTKGTRHLPDASHAGDETVTTAYAKLDPLVARNEDATNSLFDPATTATRSSSRRRSPDCSGLAKGEKPFRSVVDLTTPASSEPTPSTKRFASSSSPAWDTAKS